MNEYGEKDQSLIKVIAQLLNLVAVLIIVIIGLTIAIIRYASDPFSPRSRETTIENSGGINRQAISGISTDGVNYWMAPVISSLEGNPEKEKILYGRDLIVHTSDYFGVNGKILKASTNGMNCQNCHLEAGTKVFGNNYSAVAPTYPKYRARSGTAENVYKRVNDCIERSLNGKAIDTTSREMQSIVAYIQWLGKDVPKGKKPAGAGFKEITFLDRPANPVNGKQIYVQKCQSCHQPNGEGLRNADKITYAYPPLWGEHSYNIGAGLYRMSMFAKFVKSNMPLGASYNNPQLTDEEAWDVAAFVNSQPRPGKDLKKDWPKIEEKPFDHPFGPYADGFDDKQHKYGPFKPIQDKIAAQKKKKTKA